MKLFTLDSRLAADCIQLYESADYIVLLMDNALVPWLILVPKVEQTELFYLNEKQQLQLQRLTHRLALFIKETYSTDKLNIATIGNIVSQLHIHIVGRKIDDYCWPNVVWGNKNRQAYLTGDIEKFRQQLNQLLNR